MRKIMTLLPTLTTLLICCLLIYHGPITQLENYHSFADQTNFLHLHHVADVLSNIGFALVAIWGLLKLRRQSRSTHGKHGYILFLIGLFLTAFGSAYYHMSPDNSRIIFDRIPIALACAGILASVRAEMLRIENSKADCVVLSIFAVISVTWWWLGNQYGEGDLRPYLLIQFSPLILIPMWLIIYKAENKDKIIFFSALLLYVIAKLAELYDHEILNLLHVFSGHTLKHILATFAAGLIVFRF